MDRILQGPLAEPSRPCASEHEIKGILVEGLPSSKVEVNLRPCLEEGKQAQQPRHGLRQKVAKVAGPDRLPHKQRRVRLPCGR